MAMQATPTPSGGTPITGLVWVLNRYIQSGGNVVNSGCEWASTANSHDVDGHTTAKYTGPATIDGTTVNVFCNEYIGSTWKKRSENMNDNSEITLAGTTTKVRFTYSFPSTSHKNMTQAIIDENATFVWTD